MFKNDKIKLIIILSRKFAQKSHICNVKVI